MIQSKIVHRASNIELKVQDVFQHNFYNNVLLLMSVELHQFINQKLIMNQYITLLFGQKPSMTYDQVLHNMMHWDVCFKSNEALLDVIFELILTYDLCVIVSTRYQFWNDQCSQDERWNESDNIQFVAVEQLDDYLNTSSTAMLFPDFDLDVMRPIHFCSHESILRE